MNERVAIVAGSIGLTLGMLATVLGLGGWAFEQRQLNQHNLRLRRVLEKEPAAAAVGAGLLAEPDARLLTHRAGAETLQILTKSWPPERRGVVLATARKWPRTDVFVVGPMLYFLHFDTDDIMRDFVCMPR